jgi:hypothetical protein
MKMRRAFSIGAGDKFLRTFSGVRLLERLPDDGLKKRRLSFFVLFFAAI